MGNGQNRNRRGGARARRGPHRGGAGGDRRGATHVMPPMQASSVDATDSTQGVELAEAAGVIDDTTSASPEETIIEAVAAEIAEIAEENFERAAGELRGEPEAAASDQELGIEVASAPEASASPTHGEGPPSAEADAHTAQDAAVIGDDATTEARAAEAEPAEGVAPYESERRTPRGRFERFYAPGQGSRVEQNGQNGHTVSTPPATSAMRRPLRDSATAYESLTTGDEDEDATPSVPREDVRGSVGALIDSLHDLFVHDRVVASQGGVARCGICYFHFPISDLIYREPEGFYVCQTCERSLGAGHIPMVRRQQRL